MTDAQEVVTAVETATSEEEFDALAFFSGAALPEATVTVYADQASAYRLNELRELKAQEKERDDAEGLSITDDAVYVDPDEVEALQTKLKGSAVIFKLRGLAPAAKTAIEKKARASNPYTEGAENPEYNAEFNVNLIAHTIVSVQNVAGRFDKSTWDGARVQSFNDMAADSEFAKLYLATVKVNYIGDAIDQAVSADFS